MSLHMIPDAGEPLGDGRASMVAVNAVYHDQRMHGGFFCLSYKMRRL